MTMPFNLPLTGALMDVGRPVIAWTHDLVGTDLAYAWMRWRSDWACAIVAKPQPGVM